MSQAQIVEENIPSSFTPSVDRPFDPVGVRWKHDQMFDRNNERLTDEQMAELIENPQIQKSTRLQDLSNEANKEREEASEEIKIYNMSLKELANRTSTSMMDVMDDLVNFDPGDGFRGILHILTKSDRLVYVGIIVVVFTILLLLIKTTD